MSLKIDKPEFLFTPRANHVTPQIFFVQNAQNSRHQHWEHHTQPSNISLQNC